MKEKSLKLCCILLLLFSSNIHAQRETAHWFFGVNAGLTFNSGTPQIIEQGQINTLEGCAAISSGAGELLFYTDGETVWNREHDVMFGGTDLIGNYTSTQSAVIVPNPGNPNIYYIFTTDVVDAYASGDGESNGFNYSIVDMSQDGGLGAVTIKNINLLPNASEKVTSCIDGEGNFWVITHYLNSFYAFKVTDSGVNTVPVVSITSMVVNDYRNFRGNMKISPNGERIAVANTLFTPDDGGTLYLFDFNTLTGVVQSPQLLSDDISYYGVEFSSNSSKLYASGKLSDGTQQNIQIQQFDMAADDISSSKYIVFDYPQNQVAPSLSGSLQLGMDKRIYHSLPGNKLSTINTPNLPQENSNFQHQSVHLGFNFARFGLPAAVQSFYESVATIENLCFGEETSFEIVTGAEINTASWNFGDPASGAANFSDELSPTHVFTAPGVYNVTVNVTYTNAPQESFTEMVVIRETPIISGMYTIEQCDADDNNADGLSVFNLDEALQIIQEDNEEELNIYFYETNDDAELNENVLVSPYYANTQNEQLLYARVSSYSECFVITTVKLKVNSNTDLGVYNTVDLCELQGNSVDIEALESTISADFPDAEIGIFQTRNDALLQVGQLSNTTVFSANTGDQLFFRVSYGTTCGFIGMIEINLVSQPDAVDQQVFLCNDEGASVVLSFEENYVAYQWSNEQTTPSITVTETGTYQVTVFNEANCGKEVTFTVSETPSVEITEIKINDFQSVNSIEVIVDADSATSEITYSVNGGATFSEENNIHVTPGLYDVVVKKSGCTVAAETVLVGGFPKFFTPNGDGYNDTWQLFNKEYYPNAKIDLYDRYGKNLVSFSADTDWNGTYRGVALPAADYWYKLTLENGRIVTGHVTIKR